MQCCLSQCTLVHNIVWTERHKFWPPWKFHFEGYSKTEVMLLSWTMHTIASFSIGTFKIYWFWPRMLIRSPVSHCIQPLHLFLWTWRWAPLPFSLLPLLLLAYEYNKRCMAQSWINEIYILSKTSACRPPNMVSTVHSKCSLMYCTECANSLY